MSDNKALADRLTSMASCITPGGLNDAEIALMREAAGALSPQADKARGEVVAYIYQERYGHDDSAWIERINRTLPPWETRNVQPLYATPQPQGDATPQVSGGGELEKLAQDTTNELWSVTIPREYRTPGEKKRAIKSEILKALTALSPTQARPKYSPVGDLPDDSREAALRYIRDWCPDHVKHYIASLEPAPTADGGEAVAEISELCGMSVPGWIGDGPAPDIAVGTLLYTHPAPKAEVARLVEEYRPTMDNEVLHSWAHDVVRALTAAQQGATNGQE